MPQWLRETHAAELRQREERCVSEAERTGQHFGITLDRQTQLVLADAKRGSISEATMTKYRRDVALMMEAGQTPADKATSAKHWSRLRAAWIAVEVEAINEARAESERARKAKDYGKAQDLTREAWQRALVLDRMFYQPGARTWADKKQAMKEEGRKPVRKSKRYGPRAPTPEGLLLCLSKIRGAEARHAKRATALALFGMRPEELRKGIALRVENGLLKVKIKGAKASGDRGYEVRVCMVPAAPPKGGVDGAAAAWLASVVMDAGGKMTLRTTDADIQSLNNTLGKIAPGLSCYSFRHAVGSNLKAASAAGEVTPAHASMFMGHQSTKSLSYYGRATHGRGGRSYQVGVRKDAPGVRKKPATRKAKAEARAAKSARAKAGGGGLGAKPQQPAVARPNTLPRWEMRPPRPPWAS